MQSNMEKTAAWAKLAEEASDPAERQACASVAQVYATMVIADRLAESAAASVRPGSYFDQPGMPPRTRWWGDGS